MEKVLLPIEAKTSEERRLELANEEYRKKYRVSISAVRGYTILPSTDFIIGIETVRIFPDGLEGYIGCSSSHREAPNTMFVLIMSDRKEVIEFGYWR